MVVVYIIGGTIGISLIIALIWWLINYLSDKGSDAIDNFASKKAAEKRRQSGYVPPKTKLSDLHNTSGNEDR